MGEIAGSKLKFPSYPRRFIGYKLLRSPPYELISSDFDGTVVTCRIEGNDRIPEVFRDRVRSTLIQLMRDEIVRLSAIRTQTRMWTEFDKDGDIVMKLFNSQAMNIYKASNLESIIGEMLAHMLTQIENPALDRSGLVINRTTQKLAEIIHIEFSPRPPTSHCLQR